MVRPEGELSAARRQRLVRSILDREDDIYDFLGEGGEGDRNSHLISNTKDEELKNVLISERRERREFDLRIRTAIYWVFSNACNIPFQPDFLRIPIIHEYNSRIRQSLRDVYSYKY
jgi:hypothetical protein